MNDAKKTKKQLIQELSEMRHRLEEFEACDRDGGGQGPKSLPGRQHLDRLAVLSPAVGYTRGASGNCAITFITPNVLLHFGYRPEEFIGDPGFWLDLVHPEDRPRVVETLRRLPESELASPEYRLRHRSGEYRWIRDEMRVVSDEPGIPSEILGHCFDITDQKGAENALKETENRYRSLFEDSPISLWEEDFSRVKRYLDDVRNSGTADFEGYFREHPEAVHHCARLVRILDVNKTTLDYYGARRKEELLSSLEHVLCEESFEALRMQLLAIDRGETSFEVETTTQTLAGGTMPVLLKWSVAPGSEHTLSKVFVSLIDLSDRRKVEEALRRSESQYRTTLDWMNDYVVVVDPDLKLVLTNAAQQRMLEENGIDTNILGKDLIDALPFLSEVVRDECQEVLHTRKRMTTEVRAEIGGKQRIYEVQRLPIIEDGNVTQILNIVHEITERKQMEESLRESEELYRTVVDTSPDAITATDLDGKITFVSKRTLAMYGADKAEDLIGTNALDLIVPEDRERAVRNLEKTVRKGAVRGTEYTLLKKDGTRYPCELNASVILNAEGEPKGFIASTRDITDRKRVEEALARERKQMSVILSSLETGLSLMDRDMTITWANDKIQEMFPGIEALGSKCYEFYERGTTPCADCQADKVFGTGRTARSERYNPDNGRWYQIISQPVDDTNGNVVNVLEAVTDITDQKVAGDLLLAEKERLAVTLHGIGDGVISTDSNGNVALLNGVAEELTGWTQQEAMGKSFGDLFDISYERPHRQRRNPVEEVLKANDKVELGGDTVLLSRDGTQRIISCIASPMRGREGGTIGVVVAFRDISEKRRVEKELHNARRLESIGLLAGGIAHDFNNILTAATGKLFLAKVRAKGNESLLKVLTGAEKAIFQANGLTQQLLTFSKGGAPLKRTYVISGLVKDSAELALTDSNVTCRFSISPDLWPVEVDIGQIGQVINNLVINSAQAMPEGGVVEISAENCHVQPDSFPSLKEGRYIKLSFQDHGVGIPKEDFSRVFDPYFTTKPKGIGFGLAISYAVVKRHSGYLTFESEPGVRTVFYVYLPASDQPPVQHDRKDDLVVKGRGRILLMDDEREIRETTREVLRRLGYKVDCTSDGSEAIQRYAAAAESAAPFDAVILDLKVPGQMGGKETVKRLLEIDPSVKAIALSAYFDDPVMSNFREHGFSGIVTKPYKGEELSRVLRDVLAAGHQSALDQQ